MVQTCGIFLLTNGGVHIMTSLFSIVEGWGKSVGLFDVSPEEQALSVERMNICAACPEAKESKILLMLNGGVHDVKALYCGLCKCPVNEKSLAVKESCPIGKWEK